jgi:hypothetical protein
MMAHLAYKANLIWRKPTHFIATKPDEKLTNAAMSNSNRIIALQSIIEKCIGDQQELIQIHCRSLLSQILECEDMVPTGIIEDRETGFWAVDSMRGRLSRISEYTIDNITCSNADKAAREHYSQSFGHFHLERYEPEHFAAVDHGNLGICEKQAPQSPTFTPGMWICTCTCSKKSCLLCRLSICL